MDYKEKKLSKIQLETFKFSVTEIVATLEKDQYVKVGKEYEKLFQLSKDLICIAGTDGYFKRLNPAFEALLGWSINDLSKTSFFEFVHPDDLTSTQEEIQRLATGETTVNFTHRFKAKTG
ncbi:MAG: PAS domain-containing protein, partial [Bacteroidetes bacterium]|nr:PAS domain-containing protein [Bacteroidota bacterium]